jgi:Sigma-70, region 4
MKQIGAILGIGESRVSQIHSAALLRLRARLGQMTGKAAGAEECPKPGPMRVTAASARNIA